MNTPTDLENPRPAIQGAPQSRRNEIRAGRAISVVFFVSLGARLLSLVSQAITAAIFGTGHEMDAYVLALIVPSTIAGILSTAVGAAIIPVFIEYRENKSEAESQRLLWGATTLGALLAVVVTGLLVLAAPVLVALFGHQTDPSTQALAVVLLRFLMPILLLQGLITLFGAVLNAYNRFAVPSLAPASITLSIIAFLLLGRSWGIYALGWGTLVGYLLNLTFLVLTCLRLGLRFRLSLDWRHLGVRRIAALASPALLGALLAHANILVDQFMAALLPAGSLSALSYAVKLVDTPSQFFYLALSTALLPVFSLQAARREFPLLRDTFCQVVIFAAMVVVPVGALLSALARPVVTLLFQRGDFRAASTDVVAGAVALLAPGIFFLTYAFINIRVYQALQDNRTPRNIAVLAVVLNGVLDYLLMQVWGVAGIAFSTVLTYLITGLILLLLLKRKLPGLKLGHLGLSLAKVAGAGSLMWFGCTLLERLPLVERLPLLAQLGILSTLGLLFFVVLLWAARLREMTALWALVRSRLSPGRPVEEQAGEPG